MAGTIVVGQGGKVGPDLTGIVARDRADILTEILDPNRSVEANYRLWNVTTKDGETLSGRLEAETQTTVEILDTTAQKHVIQRKDIKKQFTYVTKLYNEEMYVIAPKSVTSISQLNGKKVSVDLPNGGTFITSAIVFERLD